MFGFKRKDTHAGHIKSNTAGTSNEISFSVLDAAKLSMDGKSGQPSDAVKGFGKISLFTLPRSKKKIATPVKEQELTLSGGEPLPTDGALASSHPYDLPTGTAASTQASAPKHTGLPASGAAAQLSSRRPSVEQEIARRKAKRRRRRVLAVLAGCIAVAALGVLVGLSYQQFYEKQQSITLQINTALQKIQQADSALVKMDQVLANPIDAASFSDIDELFYELDDAETALNESSAIIDRILEAGEGSFDDDAANYASAAIASRRTMLSTGRELLEKAYATERAVSLVSSASDQIYVADSLARDAARLVSGDLTEERMLVSYEKTKAAIEELSSARQKLVEADELSPGVGLGQYIEYVDQRIEAFEHGLASDQALIDEDTDLAVAENDAYSEADARAATLASQFPEDWLEPIRAAFDAGAAGLIDEYEQARADAGVTDSFLRNYLGIEVK